MSKDAIKKLEKRLYGILSGGTIIAVGVALIAFKSMFFMGGFLIVVGAAVIWVVER